MTKIQQEQDALDFFDKNGYYPVWDMDTKERNEYISKWGRKPLTEKSRLEFEAHVEYNRMIVKENIIFIDGIYKYDPFNYSVGSPLEYSEWKNIVMKRYSDFVNEYVEKHKPEVFK